MWKYDRLHNGDIETKIVSFGKMQLWMVIHVAIFRDLMISGGCGRDRMVDLFTTTYAVNDYHY